MHTNISKQRAHTHTSHLCSLLSLSLSRLPSLLRFPSCAFPLCSLLCASALACSSGMSLFLIILFDQFFSLVLFLIRALSHSLTLFLSSGIKPLRVCKNSLDWAALMRCACVCVREQIIPLHVLFWVWDWARAWVQVQGHMDLWVCGCVCIVFPFLKHVLSSAFPTKVLCL